MDIVEDIKQTDQSDAHKHPVKPSFYQSKFRPQILKEKKKFDVMPLPDGKKLITTSQKSAHRTMGEARVKLPRTCDFSHKIVLPNWQRERVHICPKAAAPIPVPRRPPPTAVETKPKSSLNFIKQNIEKAKNLKPHAAPTYYIHTPDGERKSTLNIYPKFTCRQGFGKVPCYLKKIKNSLQQQQQPEVKNVPQTGEQGENGPCNFYQAEGLQQMSAEERSNILRGLQHNYLEKFKQYQSMSIILDTESKKNRKRNLENELTQLESYMEFIQGNDIILVAED